MVLHLQVWESRSPPIQDSPVIIRISQYEISMKNHLDVTTSVDLSRFRVDPSAGLGHLSFESDRAFPAQC